MCIGSRRESLAFPGWKAVAIHQAMNESGRSVRTNRILEGLGRGMGEREGTGPDDDALMRSLRGQSRAEGLAEGKAEGEKKGRTKGLAEGRRQGRAEGLAEGERKGRADTLAKMARRMLRSRGVEVSEGFLADPAFATSSEDAVFEAALACADEAQFLAALR